MLTATQIAAIIMLLQAFGVDAQTIAVVKADLEPQQTQTSVSPSQTTTAANTSYSTVSFDQYYLNPSVYLGNSITVSGMESALLPSTGTSGSTNYVQITNLFNPSATNIMVNIPSSTAYTAVVNALYGKYMPAIRVYGTGASSQTFVRTSLLGSSNVILPVINASRIDLCTNGNENAVYNGSDFNSDYSCLAWNTLVQ